MQRGMSTIIEDHIEPGGSVDGLSSYHTTTFSAMFAILNWILFLLVVLVFAFIGWTWVDSCRRSRIRLWHVPLNQPSSRVLGPCNHSLGREDNLARLVREKVSSLAGPDAKLPGIWWLPGGNAQTAYTALSDFSKVDPVVYERKLLQVVDGGVLAIDISPPLRDSNIEDGEVVVLVAHGLTGGSHEHYVRSVVKSLSDSLEQGGLGARAIVMNFRGCNQSPVLTPKLYHAGSSDDVRPIVLWITQTFPHCTIFGVGFSLGANVLTKYAGEEGEECPMSGIVALANIWDWYKANQYCTHGNFLNRFVYRYVLADAARALHLAHRHIFINSPSSRLTQDLLETLSRSKRLTPPDFDNIVTSALYGFKDANDYYTTVSSVKFLKTLRIPLLGINSEDDPILGKDNLPYEEATHNPWFVFATTANGGHMGWFEKQVDGSLNRWYVKPVEQFFCALLENGLPPRRKPEAFVNDLGMVQSVEYPGVAFREVHPEMLNLFTSGDGYSKLFSGW